MRLFHASQNDYSHGQRIVATSQSAFYPLAVPALDRAKPIGLSSRDICLCATDSLAFAYLFAIKQQWPSDRIRLYEVNMKNFHRAPMAIVHAIQRRLEKSEDISALLSEYWSPKHTWHYFECIGPEMEIIGPISAPCINEIVMSLNYQGDANAAACL
ncbi:MAG: hypothetical protein AAB242_00110 [Nitrospirota bacterium]